MSFSQEHTAESGSGSYRPPPTPLHKGIWPFLCYFAFGSNSLLPHLILSTVAIVKLQTSAREYTELSGKSGVVFLSLHVADATADNSFIVEKVKCQEYELKYEKRGRSLPKTFLQGYASDASSLISLEKKNVI